MANRKKLEAVTDFLFLGSKITVDCECSHEIRRRLLGGKVITNLDSVLKSRDIALLTKVRRVKVMVFPVVTYICESWAVKKAEHQRTDAFKLLLEKTPQSPLGSKDIKPVSLTGDQHRIFTGRTDVEAEAPVF